MNIVYLFSVTADRNMFHEYSHRQRSLLPEPPVHAPRPGRTRQGPTPFLLSDYARPAPPLPLYLVRWNVQVHHRYPTLPALQAPGAFR